jgi:hypothetical protein
MPGHCVPRILPLSLYIIHCVQYIYIIFIYIYIIYIIYIYIIYILYYLILNIYIYIRLYYTNVLTQLPRYQLFAFSHYSKRTPKVLPGPGHPGDTLLVISNWNHLECLTWKLSCLIAFHQYTNDIFLRIH